eukprot:CAMPEP_0114414662 /NCGR_PEP_ID=MMETSP0103-20121206/1504_1 /TAXON_ID=37642 ORGANISM="Paraphysomonas imperforata, Strain PA2" /NCGR_SAMPLE_ID=MMETSP0103 /ASSEMBLY_ACC=CAM_ASM_000201 /LENGTH=553 /DNA_ID=CAMNT_0001582811 /DNA_START=331 /DNA_END=1992 /DNA_ORIENTATION=+
MTSSGSMSPLTLGSRSSSFTGERKPLDQLTIAEVQSLLSSCNLNKFKEAFLENEVDGETLHECISAEELKDLGITLMPKCRTFLNKIEDFKSNGGVPVKDIAPFNEEKASHTSPRRMNAIRVSGVTGELAQHINGVFKPTSSIEGGCTVFKNTCRSVYLEYNSLRRHWQIKSVKCRGTSQAWLYVVSDELVPHAAMASACAMVWTGVGEDFETQMMVKFEPVYLPVMIVGCSGGMAGQVNGTYDPTEEMCGDWVRYKKRSNPGHWLEFCTDKQQWQIKPTQSKGTTTAWAFLAAALPICSPDKVQDSMWHCHSEGGFQPQPDIVTIEEPHAVTIHGAQVNNVKGHVNGTYLPTEEVCDGYIRYKHSTKSSWLEFNRSRRAWHVKPAASKGTSNAWAYGTGYTGPEAPHTTAATWHSTSQNNTFEAEANLSILPIARPVMVALGYDLRLGQAKIGNKLGGTYDAVDTCGGWYRYKKRDSGSPEVWLEYCMAKGQWQLKPAAYKDSARAWAYVACDAARSPIEVSSGSSGACWRVYDPEEREFTSCWSALLDYAD